MGSRTDAARAEVLARRAALSDELVRLEASGRAAVDIPARMRRAPAQTAGVAAGAAFLVLADLTSRLLLAPNELPVGVVTALIGGPFFLYLLRRRGQTHGF